LIAYFPINIFAIYYENPTMLSRVIAKNIGDVFLRHTVVENTLRQYVRLLRPLLA